MGIEEKLPAGFALSTLEGLAGYMRKASMWPVTFGLACCAIEMMAVGTPDYDIARFGMERFSATPRQADLMFVAGEDEYAELVLAVARGDLSKSASAEFFRAHTR